MIACQSCGQPPNQRLTGSSSESCDWLASMSTAVVVKCLLTVAIWNQVSGVQAKPRSRSAIPPTRSRRDYAAAPGVRDPTHVINVHAATPGEDGMSPAGSGNLARTPWNPV